MIRLTRAPKPAFLTNEEERRMVEMYKSYGTKVWNRVEILSTLRASSYEKCSYCETLLDETNGMEVDHFESKSQNPDRVADWTNFVPSCRHCNGVKLSHDVVAEPIVNPFEVDPRDHLTLKHVRFFATTSLGAMTLDVLPLNGLFKQRAVVVHALEEVTQDLKDRLLTLSLPVASIERRAIQRRVRALLRAALPEKEYAATAASWISHDSDWTEVVGLLKNLGLWTDEFEILQTQASGYALKFR